MVIQQTPKVIPNFFLILLWHMIAGTLLLCNGNFFVRPDNLSYLFGNIRREVRKITTDIFFAYLGIWTKFQEKIVESRFHKGIIS